ncbi:MAG: toll/interleukin-1 receptor domain-containing protein [Pseudonocardiales bacterium]
MGGIFINYRRRGEGASFTQKLRDRLVAYFGEGQVFLDRHSIDVGEDFRDELTERLRDSEVVIAIIHQKWLTEFGRSGKDWVLEELELALKHQKKIIPLLLNGVQAPTPAAWPPSIREVAYRQAHEIRDESWEHDIEALVQKLELVLASPWEPGEPESVAPTPPRRWIGYLAAGLTVGGLVAPVWFLPDHASAREFVAYLVPWLMTLMLAPLIMVFLMFLFKKPLYITDQSLQDMPPNKYYPRVAAPAGVLLTLFSVSWIISGPVAPEVIPILIFMALLGTTYVVVKIRNNFKDEERREKNWPQRLPEPVHAAPVRMELARLERQVRDWPRHRPTRELLHRAEWQLEHLRAAGAALCTDAARGRWRWLMADHPWAFSCYTVWVAGSVGLMTAAALARLVLWLPVIVALFACGIAAATAEFAYRRARWQRTEVAEQVRDHTGRIGKQLTELRSRRG